MDIQLENVDAAHLMVVSGKDVTLEIDDRGQASVRVFITLDETTHVNHPTVPGRPTRLPLSLTKGLHFGSLTVIAIDTGAGRTYDTEIKVNGLTLATARGTLPAGAAKEAQLELFQLEVRAATNRRTRT